MTDPTARKLIRRLVDDLGLWLEYNQAPSNLPVEEERSLALVLEARRYLRYATHPRPIKEQAHAALGRFLANAHTQASQMTEDFDVIRRALEELP